MKILGHDYKLIRIASKPLGGSYGTFNATAQEISIANDVPERLQQTTILHECIEAVNAHLRLKLDESVVWQLETGLFQILTDNGVDLSPLLKDHPQ